MFTHVIFDRAAFVFYSEHGLNVLNAVFCLKSITGHVSFNDSTTGMTWARMQRRTHTRTRSYPLLGEWHVSRSWMMLSRVVILSLLAARLASTVSSRCCRLADSQHCGEGGSNKAASAGCE